MKKYLFFLSIFIILVIPLASFAVCDSEAEDSNEVCLSNPIGDDLNPQQLIGKVINTVLGITGSLALVMFIYGGFIWMLSGGSQEKVTKGKNTLVWATLGLFVIFSSYAIVRFVVESVSNTPTPT